jgi:hypothetical protein
MGILLAAGHGDEEDARLYFTHLYAHRLSCIRAQVATAEKNRNWRHMQGSYQLAAETYVLASVLYEKFPNEQPLMSDAAYDYLARFLLRNMGKLSKDFRDWYTITAMDMRAGTGMNVTVQEPIRWMVFLHTGYDMPKTTKPKKKPTRRRIK